MHVAAFNGFVAIVNMLISYGADVNARDQKAVTPLHIAALRGHVNVVQVLLAAGADHQARTAKGKLAKEVTNSQVVSGWIVRAADAT